MALLQGLLDKAEGLLEMRSHLVAGGVVGVDDLVCEGVVLGVGHSQHRGRGEHWVAAAVPALMFFCFSSCRLVAA